MKLPSASNFSDNAAEWADDAPYDSPRHHRDSKAKTLKKKRSDRHDPDAPGQRLGIEFFDDSSDVADTYRLPHTNVKFCSRSEAICAEMLRRYVPHFELREGVSFQVVIGTDCQGNPLSVDFLVDGVLFEYHPVRLFKSRRRCGDFNSKHEYRAYADICHSLSGDQREFFQAAMKSRLAKNYYAKRRALLDQHPMYRRMELVVATCPEEFYELILRRFGKNVPRSVERFLAIFEELRESLP